MNELYFLEEEYECRIPEPPQQQPQWVQLSFQFFGTVAIMLGVWYLYYRWTDSLNMDALWFAVPLAFAETMMFIGTILVVINFWKISDTPKQTPPKTKDEIVEADSEPSLSSQDNLTPPNDVEGISLIYLGIKSLSVEGSAL